MMAEGGSTEVRGERHKMAQGRGGRQEGGRPAVRRRQERNNRAGVKGATDLGSKFPSEKELGEAPDVHSKVGEVGRPLN